MAFEKACSLETPTTEVEVNELIDFTFAERNRRVGTCWIFTRSSIFLDDSFDFRRACAKTISLIPT